MGGQILSPARLRARLSQESQDTVTTLNQHVDLVTETLRITEQLLQAKIQDVSECEYQWATTKAKLAQCESEKMEFEADVVHVLAKGRIIKTGGKDLALELEAKGYADIVADAA